MRQMARLSQVDTMLNNLDDLKKALDTALDAAKKAELRRADDEAQDAVDGAARRSSTRSPSTFAARAPRTKVNCTRTIFGAFFAAQGLVTPAVANLLARVDASIAPGSTRYNAFVNGVLPGVNAALKQAGMKALPAARRR